MKTKFFLLIVCLFSSCFLWAEEASEEQLIDEEALIAAVDNLGPTAAGYSGEGNFGPQDETFIDPNVLRDFIESRGLIQCRNKQGNLTIAGDVRARWVAASEEVNGNSVRGTGTNTAINNFRSEVNLFLDYVASNTWVSSKLRWSVFDGVDGGSATRVELDRAFIGYDIYNDCEDDLYIEIGRSNLSYIFESRIEFSSFFDGIHVYYTKNFPRMGQFTIHGGPFIVDNFTNHYAWVVETGITEWWNTGWGFKYSIIDWGRKAPTLNYGTSDTAEKILIRDNPRYRFLVSQMLFGYERKINFAGCKTLFAYGAVLVNHKAQRSVTTAGKKLNGAWYAGFTLGKLCKACDWSIDINYQSVQAQAVPEFDLSGIGHGNAEDTFLSDAIIAGLPPWATIGFSNYKGVEANLLYALTDNLSLRSKAAYAVPRNSSVGGRFKYRVFEMAVIYAF